MLTETESDAMQDLLAMEIEIMESQESGATDKHALMKNHILKVQQSIVQLFLCEF